MQRHLRWAGHCIRMSDDRLPRKVLFAQLTHGTRKRFKDTAKHTSDLSWNAYVDEIISKARKRVYMIYQYL